MIFVDWETFGHKDVWPGYIDAGRVVVAVADDIVYIVYNVLKKRRMIKR
jgi:hypothetical protein